VKTRLVPPLAPADAELLYRAFLLDSLDLYSRLRPEVEPVLYLADGDDIEPMRELLAGDGVIDGSLEIRAQRGDGLGERLESAFAEAFEDGCPAACAIGTDHPTLPLEHVRSAFAAMNDHDLAIGPAADGGYYLIAMRAPAPELFAGMPYSTADLYEATTSLAVERRMRILRLPQWYDVDDAESLRRLWSDRALLPPGSRTRAALDALQSKI
jgi:uncharacterized protein